MIVSKAMKAAIEIVEINPPIIGHFQANMRPITHSQNLAIRAISSVSSSSRLKPPSPIKIASTPVIMIMLVIQAIQSRMAKIRRFTDFMEIKFSLL